MYFDNRYYSSLVERYRTLHFAVEKAQNKYDYLVSSEARRRKRRLRESGNGEDVNLQRTSGKLAEITPEYCRLREELAAGIYSIARNYAKRYRPESTGLDRDDMVQAAVIYTLGVLHRYEPQRKTSLLSWLTRCVTNTWLSALRNKRTRDAAYERYYEEMKHELAYRQNQVYELDEVA